MGKSLLSVIAAAFLISVLSILSSAGYPEDPVHSICGGDTGDSYAVILDPAFPHGFELGRGDEKCDLSHSLSNRGYLEFNTFSEISTEAGGGILTASPRAASECKILFDISHGFATWPYDIIGLTTTLRSVGYTVVTDQPDFDLTGYDVIFLSVPADDYTPAELTAIEDFVFNGGGLVISAEFAGEYGTEYLNHVAGTFGITFDSNTVHDDVQNDQNTTHWPIISNFASHPTTVGINQAAIYAGSSIQVVSPAFAIATGDTSSYVSAEKGLSPTDAAHPGRSGMWIPLGDTLPGKPIVMAACEFGDGRVWAIGDHNIWADDLNFWFIGIEYYDNRELALNVFGWVSQTGTSWLEWSGPYVAGWNLASLPCEPLDPDPDSVFGDDVMAYYLWGYDDCGYFAPDEVHGGGKGFWLGLLVDDTICVEGTLCLPKDGPICIDLDSCWNLIGGPFWVCVDWSRTEVARFADTVSLATAVSNGWVFDILYGYTSGGYVFDPTLCPGIGDWFPALVSGCELCVYPQPAPSASASRNSGVLGNIPHPGGEDWLLSLTASLQDGAADSLSAFGVSNLASEGFDPEFDFPEPPDVPSAGGSAGHVRLYFPHPEWGLATGTDFNWDVRAPLEQGEKRVWNFEVKTNRAGSAVELAWKSIGGRIPEGYSLRLIDLDHGETEYDMLRANGTTYTSGVSGAPQQFMVVATKVSEGVSTSTARSFELWQNHPNPFNPITEIKYQIPQPGHVRLSIYNVAGRLVRNIVDVQQQAGSHTVFWDGLNSQGEKVSSGIYLYRLKAGNHEMTKKMILLR